MDQPCHPCARLRHRRREARCDEETPPPASACNTPGWKERDQVEANPAQPDSTAAPRPMIAPPRQRPSNVPRGTLSHDLPAAHRCLPTANCSARNIASFPCPRRAASALRPLPSVYYQLFRAEQFATRHITHCIKSTYNAIKYSPHPNRFAISHRPHTTHSAETAGRAAYEEGGEQRARATVEPRASATGQTARKRPPPGPRHSTRPTSRETSARPTRRISSMSVEPRERLFR